MDFEAGCLLAECEKDVSFFLPVELQRLHRPQDVLPIISLSSQATVRTGEVTSGRSFCEEVRNYASCQPQWSLQRIRRQIISLKSWGRPQKWRARFCIYFSSRGPKHKSQMNAALSRCEGVHHRMMMICMSWLLMSQRPSAAANVQLSC